VRQCLEALHDCLRAEGFHEQRFLRASAIDDEGLRDVELLDADGDGLSVSVISAGRMTATLDRTAGRLELRFFDGHRTVDGERNTLSEDGWPLVYDVDGHDGIGRWRTEDNGEVVADYGSAIHVLRDFGPINGPEDLRAAILSQPERFVRPGTEKLMTYALGRALTPADMPTARAIVREAGGADYRFSALVLGVVTSDAFQMRMAGTDADTRIALDSSL
jgi:hypothetical protein